MDYKTNNNSEVGENTNKDDSNKFNFKKLNLFERDDSDVEILFEHLGSKNKKILKFKKNANSTESSSLHQSKKFVNQNVDRNVNEKNPDNSSEDLVPNCYFKNKEEKIKCLTDLFPQIDNEYIEDVLIAANWNVKVAKDKVEENRKKPCRKSKFLKRKKYKACNNNENENINKNGSNEEQIRMYKVLKSDLEPVLVSMENKEPQESLLLDQNKISVDQNVDSNANGKNSVNSSVDLEHDYNFKNKEEKIKYLTDLFPQINNEYIEDILLAANWDVKVAKYKVEENRKKPCRRTKFLKRKKYKACNNNENENINKNGSNEEQIRMYKVFKSDLEPVLVSMENEEPQESSLLDQNKKSIDQNVNSNTNGENPVNSSDDLVGNSDFKDKEEKIKCFTGLFPQNDNKCIEDTAIWNVKVAKEKSEENHEAPCVKDEYSKENKYESCNNSETQNIDKDDSNEQRLKKCKVFKSDLETVLISMKTEEPSELSLLQCNESINQNIDSTNEKNPVKSSSDLEHPVFKSDSETVLVSMKTEEPTELSLLHQCNESVNQNIDSINEKNPVKSSSDLEHTNSELKYKNAIIKYMSDLFPHIDSKSIEDVLFTANWDIQVAKDKLEENTKTNHSSPRGKRKVYCIDEENNNKRDSEKGQHKKRKVVKSNDDSDVISYLTKDEKVAVLEFMENALSSELLLLNQCSEKKVNAIIKARPFKNWKNLVWKLEKIKCLDATEFLDAARDLIKTRKAVDNLMKKCLCLSERVEKAITAGSTTIKEQPKSLSSKYTLSPYQMVGLNWLAVMHAEKVNGILADEMGLGKTVQVIAFLTYLKEAGLVDKKDGPHLIVVPSSTMENWGNELRRWSPGLRVVQYYGSQDERKKMRLGWHKGDLKGVDVILTTYSFVSGSIIERKLFRKLPMKCVIFDEAHMLKNMCTLRYKNLVKINAKRRILLTGTPLQNNLLELMSLLTFAMPSMFTKEKEKIINLFSKNPKASEDKSSESKPMFEEEQIKNAKLVIKPFILRRLKTDVLNDLPKKTNEVIMCPMLGKQKEYYTDLLAQFSAQFYHYDMIISLRKMANHPLLFRNYYDEEKLTNIARRLIDEPGWKEKDFQYTYEVLLEMSDFKMNQLSRNYKSLAGFGLPLELIPKSGKLKKLDELLPDLKENGHRVLIFSQFTMVLDILGEYLTIRGHKYLRLDGSTPVLERQNLIDEFTEDSGIFVFLLSTRAGGLGINLTSADTVIIHDIDFNPYNDKQAEDRCHRVGQEKPVRIIRLLSNGTVEEHMYKLAQEKLDLELRITGNKDISGSTEKKDVLKLLKMALDGDKSLILSPNRNEELNGLKEDN